MPRPKHSLAVADDSGMWVQAVDTPDHLDDPTRQTEGLSLEASHRWLASRLPYR